MDNLVSMHDFIVGYAVVYCGILFFDTIFKTCMFYPYLTWMNEMGLSIKPYGMVWSVTRLNRVFQRIGNFMPYSLKRCYNMGFYVTFFFSVISMGFLMVPVIRYPFQSHTRSYAEPMVSVIPGVTTPFSHIIYIIPALVISMLFHELGHAVAASREQVPVESCGIALVLIFPVAFVNLAYHRLNLCTHKQKLRVYCAGVWHNLILLAIGFVFVSYTPLILYPGLRTGAGVTIMDIKETSSLAHQGGFLKGDVAISMNGCEVTDEKSWYQCLADIESSPQIGFCSSEEFIMSYGNISNCCKNSSQNLCFKPLENELDQFVCLPARKFIDDTSFCKNSTDCINKKCLIPFLPEIGEKLIKFERQDAQSVLFIGSSVELILSVKVSSWVCSLGFSVIEFVIHVENFFKYLAGISAGLAVMNVVPCYLLDGGYITENIVDRYFKRYWSYTLRNTLVSRLKFVGFMLIVINIYTGIDTIIFQDY